MMRLMLVSLGYFGFGLALPFCLIYQINNWIFLGLRLIIGLPIGCNYLKILLKNFYAWDLIYEPRLVRTWSLICFQSFPKICRPSRKRWCSSFVHLPYWFVYVFNFFFENFGIFSSYSERSKFLPWLNNWRNSFFRFLFCSYFFKEAAVESEVVVLGESGIEGLFYDGLSRALLCTLGYNIFCKWHRLFTIEISFKIKK